MLLGDKIAWKNPRFKRSRGKYKARSPKCVVIVKKYYGRKKGYGGRR